MLKHHSGQGSPLSYFYKNKSLVTGLAAVVLTLGFVSTVLISGQSGRLAQVTNSSAAGGGTVTFSQPTCGSIYVTATNLTSAYGPYHMVRISDSAGNTYTEPDGWNATNGTLTNRQVGFSKQLINGQSYTAQLMNFDATVSYTSIPVGNPLSFVPSCPSSVPDVRGNVSYSNLSCGGLSVNASSLSGTIANVFMVKATDTTGADHRSSQGYVYSSGTSIINGAVTFNPGLVNGHRYELSLYNVDGTISLAGFEVKNLSGGSNNVAYTANCPSGAADVRGNVEWSNLTCTGVTVNANSITGEIGNVYGVNATDQTGGSNRTARDYIRSNGSVPATITNGVVVFNNPLVHGRVYRLTLLNVDGTVSLTGFEVKTPAGGSTAINYTANCPSTPVPVTPSPTPIACNNIDVVLSLDNSGSMSGSKITDLTKATNSFVAKLKNTALTNNSSIYSGVTIFNSSSAVLTSLRPVAGLRTNYTFTASGGTAMWKGILAADKELNRVAYTKRAILLMSDGRANLTFSNDPHPKMKLGPNDPERYKYVEDWTAKEAYAKYNSATGTSKSTSIYTVGFGRSHNAPWLTTLSGITNGKYYSAADGTALTNAFNDIASRVCTTSPSTISSSEYTSLLGKN
ncbi:MAG: VWA domain-containing protein [bacterium]|nr:VWA domain-containing protein [bacterium]